MIRRYLLHAEEDGSGSAGDEAGGESKETLLGKESSGDATGDDEGDGDKAEAKADGEGSDEDGAGDDEKGEADGDEKPGEFNVSEFEVPEGTEINEAWMGKLTSDSAIQKLTQNDVQGLIGMVGEFINDQEGQRATALTAQIKEWEGACEEDPWVKEQGGLEKAVPLAKAFMKEFLKDPELEKLLTQTGLGSNPVMLAGFGRAAEALRLKVSDLEGGGTPPGIKSTKTQAEKMFPDYTADGKYGSNAA
jgi:hypothetical protein